MARSFTLGSGLIDGPTIVVTIDDFGNVILKQGQPGNREAELRVVEDQTAYDLAELTLRLAHRLGG